MSLLILSFLLLFTAPTQPDIPITTPSIIERVTVYRTSALITRTAAVKLKPGKQTISIENLSQNIKQNTLNIGSNGAYKINSAELSGSYSDALFNDVSHGCASVTLEIESAVAQEITISFAYEIIGAGWNPVYEVHLDKMDEPATLVYKASVFQHSGVDWKNVQVFISPLYMDAGDSQPHLIPDFTSAVNRNVVPGSNGYTFSDDEQLFDSQNAFQGRTSGTLITTESGNPGGAFSTLIRGASSLESGEQPLFIVDGVQISFGETSTQVSQSPLAAINPDLIQSIEIIKDVATASLYGANGSNGVVIVTTKSAKTEQAKQRPQIKKERRDLIIPADTPPVIYTLGNNVEFISGNDSYTVTLNTEPIKVDYAYHSTPSASPAVLLMTNLHDSGLSYEPNSSAKIFIGNTLIREVNLSSAQVTDPYAFSLGADQNIKVSKMIDEEKTERKISDDKIKEIRTFEIEIQNTNKVTSTIHIQDQIPISVDPEVKISVRDLSKAKIDKASGLLNWKVKVKAGKTKILRVSYQIEYARNKALANN